jgi:peroxiredoxin
MKEIVLTAMAFLPVLAFAQDGKYTVQGKIGNYNAPAKVYIEYALNGKNVTDSTTVKDGNFQFTGKIGTPAQAYLILNEKGSGVGNSRDYKAIYLEKGIIKVTSTDVMTNATIEGPKTNQENARYEAMMKPIYGEEEAIEVKQKAATTDEAKSELNKEEKVAEAKETALSKKFIQDNPDSYISMNALESYAYGADYADIAPLYNALSPEVKASASGKEFGDRLPKLKAVALGAMAPVFAEADTSGKTVSLESFRGKYVLVDFWASWCGPCRAENPNVVKAFNRYKGKNFTIIGVSLDGPRGKMDLQKAKQSWLTAIHKDGLNWTQLSDLQFWKSKEAELYAVRGIPQNFLIDPSGKIIAKNLRGDDLEDKLAELFGKI